MLQTLCCDSRPVSFRKEGITNGRLRKTWPSFVVGLLFRLKEDKDRKEGERPVIIAVMRYLTVLIHQ